MTITPVSEIPTVSLLYHLKKLVPAPTTPEFPGSVSEPGPSFNDRIGLIRGDITKLEVDAIVNAANNSLLGGGGVDGAIHRAAGPELYDECRQLNGCETGSAKVTDAYRLPCKKVIHAVGPIYHSEYIDECTAKLAGCYTTSLRLAVKNGCKSIAFSALSTGVYGYPSNDAAQIAIRAVKDFLANENGDAIEKVVFCTFVPRDVNAYNHWLPRYFPPAKPKVTPTDEEEWENVEEGETAENGEPEVIASVANEEPVVEAAGEVPKLGSVTDGGPSLEKQKPNTGSD